MLFSALNSGLFHREDFGDDILTLSAPGEGAEVAVPLELHTLARAAHQAVGQRLVGDRELELVAPQAVGIGVGGLEAALYHLALIGLEDDALPLEVVDVARIDATAVDEAEAEVEEQRQRQHEYERNDGDNL